MISVGHRAVGHNPDQLYSGRFSGACPSQIPAAIPYRNSGVPVSPQAVPLLEMWTAMPGARPAPLAAHR